MIREDDYPAILEMENEGTPPLDAVYRTLDLKPMIDPQPARRASSRRRQPKPANDGHLKTGQQREINEAEGSVVFHLIKRQHQKHRVRPQYENRGRRLLRQLELRSEPRPVFTGSNEGLDHFSSDEVAVELIQFGQPKLIAGIVRVLRIVWIAA